MLSPKLSGDTVDRILEDIFMMNRHIWYGAGRSLSAAEDVHAGGRLLKYVGIVSLVILLLLCGTGSVSAAWDGTVNSSWYANEIAAGHNGMMNNPYLVHDEKSLAALANETNQNTSLNGFENKYILLTADLDLNGATEQWSPIGSKKGSKFKGTFIGGGHTIDNMNITYASTGEYYRLGLFGYAMGATIQDVHLTDVVVQINSTGVIACAGGLVGESEGTKISNCSVTGTMIAEVAKTSYAGGLVAWSKTTKITNSSAEGTVRAVSGEEVSHAGGLVGGANNSRIDNSFAESTVSANSLYTSTTGQHPVYAGGLVGLARFTTNITNSFATGNVKAEGNNAIIHAGGLVAVSDYNTIMINCSAKGTVHAIGNTGSAHAGGLAGLISGNTKILGSNALSTVTVTANGNKPASAGGLVGAAEYSNTIADCSINGGDVTANGTGNSDVRVGGLVGYIDTVVNGRIASLTNCSVTTATVNADVAGSAFVGGLAGYAKDVTITHVGAEVTVTAKSTHVNYAGGLVGRSEKNRITDCYATGTVTSTSTGNTAHAGGLAGFAGFISYITNCYATGTVTADSSSSPGSSFSACAGGLVGKVDSGSNSMTHCYATGDVTAKSSGSSYAGGLVGNDVTGTITITNAAALNNRVTAAGTPSNTGRFVGNGTLGTETYAWRHMELNISGTSIKPVSAGGINATNASTVMIWGNETFFTTLFSGYSANWIMGTDTAYRLPLLKNNIPGQTGMDASHLNVSHAITIHITGEGTITQSPSGATIPDGTSVTFTLSPSDKLISLLDTDTNISPLTSSYTIADADCPHTIVATFQQPSTPTPTQTGIPTPSPTPTGGSGSGDGNMEESYRVLFETNGGGFISPVTGLSSGDTIPEPPQPQKPGYTFGGWYTNEACTNGWNFANGIQSDMILYAKWIQGGMPAETVTATPVSTPEIPTQEPTTIPTVEGIATASPIGGATIAPPGGDTDIAPPADTGDDNTSGKYYNTGALCFLLLLLFLFLLCLILLLRHTVTFLIPTSEGIERYRIKVWHGKRIDPDNLPELLLTAAWYLDEEREERWDIEEDRVTRSIRLYHG